MSGKCQGISECLESGHPVFTYFENYKYGVFAAMYIDEEAIPKKRSRRSKLKADKDYDSDQDGYDRKSSGKLRTSELKGTFVIDDGDDNSYQSRIRYFR